MTKLVLLTIGALLVASGSTAAADLAMPPPAQVETPVAAAYDWTGPYIGANAGFGWGTLNYDPDAILGVPAGSFATNGWLAGLTLGYNAQLSSNFVIGVEGDIDSANISGSGAPFDPTSAFPTVPSTTINWLGTIRGRAGFAADNFLVYATAGLAAGGISGELTNVTAIGDSDNRSASGTQWGWVAGAGIEAAVAENVTVKAEYLYTDLGTTTYTFPGPGAAVAADIHPTASIVRLGINYRF